MFRVVWHFLSHTMGKKSIVFFFFLHLILLRYQHFFRLLLFSCVCVVLPISDGCHCCMTLMTFIRLVWPKKMSIFNIPARKFRIFSDKWPIEFNPIHISTRITFSPFRPSPSHHLNSVFTILFFFFPIFLSYSEDNLRQLHGIQESIQRMRQVSVQTLRLQVCHHSI